MHRQPTALVLGAGSSFAYGYPVGKGLRQQILQITKDSKEFAAQAAIAHPAPLVTEFFKAFRYQ